MGARICKCQYEDIILDHVKKHPVVFDMAISKANAVAYKGMIMVLRW